MENLHNKYVYVYASKSYTFGKVLNLFQPLQ